MRVPPDAIRDEDEIIDQIVEQLRPLQYDEAYTRRVLANDIAQLQERRGLGRAFIIVPIEGPLLGVKQTLNARVGRFRF
jgi:hypothetical protein